ALEAAFPLDDLDEDERVGRKSVRWTRRKRLDRIGDDHQLFRPFARAMPRATAAAICISVCRETVPCGAWMVKLFVMICPPPFIFDSGTTVPLEFGMKYSPSTSFTRYMFPALTGPPAARPATPPNKLSAALIQPSPVPPPADPKSFPARSAATA